MAPELVLTDLEGNAKNLADYNGKLVVLNFLASWCKPCEEEMPSLNRLQALMKDSLQIVAIGVEDDDDALREFRDRANVQFPFLHDKSGYSKQR
ncbi:MAG: TlpA family protein disulfide reductase, partial [Bdellovibrionales bacterium]|nr:TlpA family protein disulfide reductase [Bdellovibrionales bacterium]